MDPIYIVAEAGLNHNGSLELALRMIDEAAKAGANAVKFQKRTVDILAIGSVLDAPDHRFPEFGSTYRAVREHIEFDLDAYRAIQKRCQERNVEFLCTAFDIPAVDFLEQLQPKRYKLASHSLGNLPLLEHVARLGKPTILSTGMAEWEEIDRAVAIFIRRDTPLILMHCVSIYPTPPGESNLLMIDELRNRYGLPVGYSGHEIGTLPTLASAVMRVCMIERHFTLDRTLPGFDHKISLEPAEFTRMVYDLRAIEIMLGYGEKKVTEEERITRNKYHVSMVSARSLAQGEILTEDAVVYRNPGTGIPPKQADLYLGRPVVRDIPADVLIEPDMVQQD